MILESRICIICGNEFLVYARRKNRCCSWSCRKEHFKRKNIKTCRVCNKIFVNWRKQSICSITCRTKSLIKRIDNTCKYCGKSFQTVPSETRIFCSKTCGARFNSPWTVTQERLLIQHYQSKQYRELEEIIGHNRKAIDHKIRTKYPELKKNKPAVNLFCDQCSKLFRRCFSLMSSSKWGNFCSRKCRAIWISESGIMAGENSPQWRGGYFPYFGANWGNVRRKIRKIKSLMCLKCGIIESQLPQELHVHHIVPRRMFTKVEDSNTLENLILLCAKCHKEVENNIQMPKMR